MQLDGVRVLDFSIWRPGPYATQLLAERGAQVTKIEPPGGDPMRAYPELFDQLNGCKECVELDLKSDGDRARALDLASEADVAVEGYRPGVASRLGIDYDALRALRSDVIYCSVSGFGQSGPMRDAPGHDLNYLAWTGALAPDGGDPRWPALPIADLGGGMAAAFEICAALVQRERSGTGTYIDVSLTDVMASWTGGASSKVANVDTTERGAPGYGIFATADGGHIALGIINEDHFWQPLCDALSLADVRDLAFPDRMKRLTELHERLATAIATRKRDELVELLLRAGVPAAPVLDRAGMVARRAQR